jgi:hypothetical protein
MLWTRRRLLLATALAPLAAGEAAAAPSPAAQEWRIVARQGVVRIYRPTVFRARDAGLALYVHGLHTDLDRAWREHRLPEQFEASGRNALFIAPAARSATGEPIPWPDLEALLEAAGADLGVRLPEGPAVVAGHSGAYRVIGAWLGHPRVRTILLLDGLYGHQADFRAWLNRRARHRMALVSKDTAVAAAAWSRTMRYVVRRPRCPDQVGELTRRERRAKVLSMGTRAGHFGIVTEGKILPLLLRWSRLPGRA